LLHQDHCVGWSFWKDSEGILHGAGPVGHRESIFESFMGVTVDISTQTSHGVGPSSQFTYSEHFLTKDSLSRAELGAFVRLLRWKDVVQEFRGGHIPKHMEDVNNKYYALVTPSPVS
jgi:hypothetical protein